MRTFSDTSKKGDSLRKRSQPLEYLHSPDASPESTLYRKASCACGGGCSACSARSQSTKVSRPTDAAEIEADQIADRIMRMPANETQSQPSDVSRSPNHESPIQRKCDACEKDEEQEETVQRKEGNVAASDAPPEPPPAGDDDTPSVREAVGSGGFELDPGTRSFFEPRLGIDLGNVRIHTGATAARSASALNAKAYTLGSDIVFGNGQYRPSDSSGKHLLAHELAHVAQGAGSSVMRNVIDSETVHRAADLDDVFESPTGGGGTQSGETGAPEKKQTCPPVPTHLGDEIPEPSCPRATHIGTNEVARFKFCLDSDQLISPGDSSELATIVSSNHPKTKFLVHGYASPEGRVDYNFNLACHRANRIAEEMHGPIGAQVRSRLPADAGEERVNTETGAEIQARIETATQGPTSKFGAPEENRLVIVYAQGPQNTTPDEEPSCADAHGKIGDVKPELAPDSPTVDLDGSKPDDHHAHMRFCKDSDVFKEMSPADVRKFAHAQASKTNFIVHGFASPEGDAEYNRRLSHHRALRVARELINAGVRPEQVTEVAAIGETTKFGDDDANRVAVIFAQGGEIGEFEDSKHEAKTAKQKQAIIDEARQRLISGQYNLAADAYISFWTCGRTQTVGQAVERLTIKTRSGTDSDKNEILTDEANGREEGIGVNTVTISNAALRADNGIECTMGRLVDMSFHHSEIGNPDLASNFASRHQAGLHLIHLAGLGQCTGKAANPTVQLGKVKGGIDKPRKADPRSKRTAPPCAQTLEPTRLHFPTEGEKDRTIPEFTSENKEGPATYTLLRGRLGSNFDPGAENKGAQNRTLITHPQSDMLTAKAHVKLKGDPKTFSDYEVGFIQSVISDETQADYGSGHSVIEQLPVPIRMAGLKGEVPVPEPWTTLDSMAVPKADGSVDISTFGIRLNTETAIGLKLLNRDLPNVPISRFEHGSRIAIWLIARRRGAPLDRFSIHFIDGVTYDLTQVCRIEHRHVKGIMSGGAPFRSTIEPDIGGEGEVTAFVGSFLANNKSELPADPSAMRFRSPVTSDINLFNQVKKIVEPSRPTEKDMDKAQITAVVKDILDNLEVFDSKDDAAKDIGGKKEPRLGFDFIPLTITLPFIRATGRLKDPENPKDIPTQITSTGLGDFAAFHLRKALDFRIRSRDFGEDVIARPSILEGKDPTIGTVTINLPPLPRKSTDSPDTESDLLKRPDVIRDMAEAWACTELTSSEPFEGREFGRSYSMDRNKVFHPIPDDRLKMGEPEAPDGSFTTILPCADDPDGVNLGGFHTHPVPDPIPPEPSDPADTTYYNETCRASQQFIVTDNRVFRVSPDGKSTREVRTLPKAPGCQKINLEGRKKRPKSGDDFDF